MLDVLATALCVFQLACIPIYIMRCWLRPCSGVLVGVGRLAVVTLPITIAFWTWLILALGTFGKDIKRLPHLILAGEGGVTAAWIERLVSGHDDHWIQVLVREDGLSVLWLGVIAGQSALLSMALGAKNHRVGCLVAILAFLNAALALWSLLAGMHPG